MDRDLTVVLDSIIAIVPESETALLAELKSLKSSAAYAAPEMMGRHWNEGGRILRDHIPNTGDLAEWQGQIVNIWTARDCKN